MLQAVIWDMDGVIVDSGPSHLAAWDRLFAELGSTATAEDIRPYFGRRTGDAIRGILGDMPDADVAAILNRKEQRYRDVAVNMMRVLPGVVDLMTALEDAGVPQALATSASSDNVAFVLGMLPRPPFACIVGAEDVQRGKPFPDVFLAAARRLGGDPARTVVIEDSRAGVQAAKAGGFRCLAVVADTPANLLSDADRIVASLADVSLPDLQRLVDG